MTWARVHTPPQLAAMELVVFTSALGDYTLMPIDNGGSKLVMAHHAKWQGLLMIRW